MKYQFFTQVNYIDIRPSLALIITNIFSLPSYKKI